MQWGTFPANQAGGLSGEGTRGQSRRCPSGPHRVSLLRGRAGITQQPEPLSPPDCNECFCNSGASQDSERANAQRAETSPPGRAQHPPQAPPVPAEPSSPPTVSPLHQHLVFFPLSHIYTIRFPRRDWNGILPMKYN